MGGGKVKNLARETWIGKTSRILTREKELTFYSIWECWSQFRKKKTYLFFHLSFISTGVYTSGSPRMVYSLTLTFDPSSMSICCWRICCTLFHRYRNEKCDREITAFQQLARCRAQNNSLFVWYCYEMVVALDLSLRPVWNKKKNCYLINRPYNVRIVSTMF